MPPVSSTPGPGIWQRHAYLYWLSLGMFTSVLGLSDLIFSCRDLDDFKVVVLQSWFLLQGTFGNVWRALVGTLGMVLLASSGWKSGLNPHRGWIYRAAGSLQPQRIITSSQYKPWRAWDLHWMLSLDLLPLFVMQEGNNVLWFSRLCLILLESLDLFIYKVLSWTSSFTSWHCYKCSLSGPVWFFCILIISVQVSSKIHICHSWLHSTFFTFFAIYTHQLILPYLQSRMLYDLISQMLCVFKKC